LIYAGQIVGIREVDDQIWPVSFLDFELVFFDREESYLESKKLIGYGFNTGGWSRSCGLHSRPNMRHSRGRL
jgi:hypothetical protein